MTPTIDANTRERALFQTASCWPELTEEQRAVVAEDLAGLWLEEHSEAHTMGHAAALLSRRVSPAPMSRYADVLLAQSRRKSAR